MGRWKPPSTEVSSPYITRAGYERMKAEYDHLWRERRPEVVRALAAAAAEGDRSENAEYIYRKKELREIDRRVGYLQRRLPDLKVVEMRPSDPSRVFFGATVRLADDDGATREVCIVGGDETDAAAQAISLDSPLAKALMKRQAGDAVNVQLPSGPVRYEIVGVRYS